MGAGATAAPESKHGRHGRLSEKANRDADYLLAPLLRVRLFHDGRLTGPFVYSSS